MVRQTSKFIIVIISQNINVDQPVSLSMSTNANLLTKLTSLEWSTRDKPSTTERNKV